MASERLARIAHLFKKEISQIIARRVHDPRIGFVSITDVVISPDIKHANIYVSVLGNEKEKNESIAGLKSAAGFIRAQLCEIVELKTMPELRFLLDESLERGSRILVLMQKLKKEEAYAKKSNKKRRPANKK